MYLGDYGLLALPSFKDIDCDMETPLPMYDGYGVIIKDHTDRLMFCDSIDCFLQMSDGWHNSTSNINLYR